jgi:hypothetical protein
MEIWKDGFAVVQAQEHEDERRRNGRLIGEAEDVSQDASQDWRSQRLAKPKMLRKIDRVKDVTQDWRSQRCFARLLRKA